MTTTFQFYHSLIHYHVYLCYSRVLATRFPKLQREKQTLTRYNDLGVYYLFYWSIFSISSLVASRYEEYISGVNNILPP